MNWNFCFAFSGHSCFGCMQEAVQHELTMAQILRLIANSSGDIGHVTAPPLNQSTASLVTSLLDKSPSSSAGLPLDQSALLAGVAGQSLPVAPWPSASLVHF